MESLKVMLLGPDPKAAAGKQTESTPTPAPVILGAEDIIKAERARVAAIQALAAPGFEAKASELSSSGATLEEATATLCAAYKEHIAAQSAKQPEAPSAPDAKAVASEILASLRAAAPAAQPQAETSGLSASEIYAQIEDPIERGKFLDAHRDEIMADAKKTKPQTKEA
jgi:hypothetical protein